MSCAYMMMKSYWGKAIAVLPKPMQDRTGRPLLNVVFNVFKGRMESLIYSEVRSHSKVFVTV